MMTYLTQRATQGEPQRNSVIEDNEAPYFCTLRYKAFVKVGTTRDNEQQFYGLDLLFSK